MAETIKKYSNGEVTIVWKPTLCTHSTICWKKANSLPEVFKPAEKPWIRPEGASTERIKEQISRCPSGALTYEMNQMEDSNIEEEIVPETNNSLQFIPNGPILVSGSFTMKDPNGNTSTLSNSVALCRCGQSANKPYCDGSHVTSEFIG
jgi:uncharacterized Fe-S cluster protein YjdI|tara:strand:+ start:39 stop:485 length:447 start_codon:yes stop_codon:yes gene_type:complete